MMERKRGEELKRKEVELEIRQCRIHLVVVEIDQTKSSRPELPKSCSRWKRFVSSSKLSDSQ